MRHTRSFLRIRLQRWQWALLWLALVFAPVQAQMHAVAHAPELAYLTEHAAPDGHWGHAAGAADCVLLDQLLHGAAPLDFTLPVVPPVQQRLPVWRPCRHATTTWPPFQARAPPFPAWFSFA